MKVKHKSHYFTLWIESEIKGSLFRLQLVKRTDEVAKAPLGPAPGSLWTGSTSWATGQFYCRLITEVDFSSANANLPALGHLDRPVMERVLRGIRVIELVKAALLL